MSVRNSKLTLLGVAAAFVLPVLIAKLALDNGWFTQGATNRGELLQPTRDLSAVLVDEEPKWRLVYSVPANCDQACENAIFSIHQVWMALGRETDRAQATVLVSESSDASVLGKLGEEHNLHLVEVSERALNQAIAADDSATILLVDTLNNAMLRYPVSGDRQTAIQRSRDILADVKKLLKLSRIG